MKRSIQTVFILPLLLLAACGGGDKATDPPAVTGQTDPESLKILKSLAQNAIDSCCKTASVYMVQYGSAVSNLNPYAGQVDAALANQPKYDACMTAVMNFETQFRTTANGTYPSYAPAEKWRKEQGRAVINCVGGNMQAAGLPVDAASLVSYGPGISNIASQFSSIPGVSGSNPYANTGVGSRGLASQSNNYGVSLTSTIPLNGNYGFGGNLLAPSNGTFGTGFGTGTSFPNFNYGGQVLPNTNIPSNSQQPAGWYTF
jgi:hypothetical protein